jgi:hypothetical protein
MADSGRDGEREGCEGCASLWVECERLEADVATWRKRALDAKAEAERLRAGYGLFARLRDRIVGWLGPSVLGRRLQRRREAAFLGSQASPGFRRMLAMPRWPADHVKRPEPDHHYADLRTGLVWLADEAETYVPAKVLMDRYRAMEADLARIPVGTLSKYKTHRWPGRHWREIG